MSELLLPRRKFLFGLTGVFAAPAIVKASSLMRVTPIIEIPRPIIYANRTIRSPVDLSHLDRMREDPVAFAENVYGRGPAVDLMAEVKLLVERRVGFLRTKRIDYFHEWKRLAAQLGEADD